jgi:hypothetical protein
LGAKLTGVVVLPVSQFDHDVAGIDFGSVVENPVPGTVGSPAQG